VAGGVELDEVEAGAQAGELGERATVDAHAGVGGDDGATYGPQRALVGDRLQEGEVDVGAVEGAVGAALGVEGEGEGVAVAGAELVAGAGAGAVGQAELELDVPQGRAAQLVAVEGAGGVGLEGGEAGDHVVVALLEVGAAGRDEAELDGAESRGGGSGGGVGLGEQASAQRAEVAELVALGPGGGGGPVGGGARGAGPQEQLAGFGAARGEAENEGGGEGAQGAQEGREEASEASGVVPYDGGVSGTRRLGRYEVGERVGSGGLAEVYVAHVEGAQGFRKRLVIKQLRSELHAHPEAFALLLAEAQLVQRLSHGNIVQVFDFGVDAQTPYLVMEHVDGISLADLLRDARERDAAIDASAALFVVESVCAALEYAHTAVDEAERPLGLVHRDVTPANILLSREGRVMLTDFGIARLSAVGAEGRAIGTPGYRAPEQAAGEEVDRRADVFSLGVVIAELAERVAEGPLREGLRGLAARASTVKVAERIADAGSLGRELELLRGAVPRGTGELAERVRRVQRERQRVANNVEAALKMRGRTAQTEALVGPPVASGRPRARWVVMAVIVVVASWAVWLVLDASEPLAPAEGSLVAEGEEGAARDEVVAATPGAGEAAARGEEGTASTGVVQAATSAAIEVTKASTVSPARGDERAPRVRPVPGRLRVNVIPWAEASLDGAPIGRTPIDRRVAAGKHTLELRNPESGQRRAREIEVGRGGEVNITEW
jgi:tRNA A-37 threonylcarbamoyl transferase component Bud32